MKVVNRVTSTDGTSIAFERVGGGPPLIMVDPAGAFSGFRPMTDLPGHLAQSFTVITYDRRGRGDSTDTPPYSVDREVDDLEALLDAVGGSAFVYGFSSGAVLALHAAARGLPIDRLALLEPPLAFPDEPADEADLGAEIAELVAAGRRSDAVEHFNRSIGVPPEMIDGMRDAPFWPALESIAHTLVYDTIVTGRFDTARLSAITTPTLVIDSSGSDERLQTWAQRVVDALPNGELRMIGGEWHGVPASELAKVMREFFIDR